MAWNEKCTKRYWEVGMSVAAMQRDKNDVSVLLLFNSRTRRKRDTDREHIENKCISMTL